MAKVKNVSGKVRLIPSMGWRRVEVGALLEVKPDEVYGFTCQPANWAPGDAEAKKAHKAGAEASRAESITNLPASEALAVYDEFVEES